jgi:hypothetical protein
MRTICPTTTVVRFKMYLLYHFADPFSNDILNFILLDLKILNCMQMCAMWFELCVCALVERRLNRSQRIHKSK